MPVASTATCRRGRSGEFTMYYVYVLRSVKDNKLYIGKTKDLEARVQRHYKGAVQSTKGRRPLKLVFYEAFGNKTDAGRDELFYISGFGREALKSKLKNSLK